MRFTIELCHPKIKINYVNSLGKILNTTETTVEIEVTADTTVTIYTNIDIPHATMIRVNGFLLNRWIADITITNNQLCLSLGADFYKKYNGRDIQGRLNSLGSSPTEAALDRNIGKNLHPELVSEIKTLLDEKRRTTAKLATN